jgi:hypothetical protein
MGSPEPSIRLLELLREHMREVHGREPLRRKEIKCLGDPESPAQKAIWNPGKPDSAASFGCTICPPGTLVPARPGVHYGDAGRNYYVLETEGLQSQILGLQPDKQAEYLERFDRGELLAAHAAETRRLLDTARRTRGKARTNDVRDALRDIMRRRVGAGEQISQVIDDLEHRSASSALAFTCYVGRELGLARPGEKDSEKLAERTADALAKPAGSRLSAVRSTLWNYWNGGRF